MWRTDRCAYVRGSSLPLPVKTFGLRVFSLRSDLALGMLATAMIKLVKLVTAMIAPLHRQAMRIAFL